jgi:hypothetical protein
VEIGNDNYHAEIVFAQGGVVRIHTLGQDESKVQEVDAQTLTAYVKPEGSEAVAVEFRPEPAAGDAPGKTSQFVGKLPPELRGQGLEFTVPGIRIAGERFRFRFATPEESPDKVVGEAEKTLYLTPGGLYSEADIQANGGQTASQKYRGFKPRHDLKPKPGDKVCPITVTKANPQCTWVVGGKTYEFCCPPCIDEFVQQAKDKPGEIKQPQDYVK